MEAISIPAECPIQSIGETLNESASQFSLEYNEISEGMYKVFGELTAETDKSYKINDIWFPISQTQNVEIEDRGSTKLITCEIPDWIVNDRLEKAGKL